MSAPSLVRPAARSAAVRPHSTSFLSPWPASAASRWRASLFFVSRAPALWQQSYWLASACRSLGPGGVVTGTALVTALVTPKPLRLLDIPEPLPRYHSPPAHVIRSRARACASSPLSLVTWEQRIIVYVVQWLGALPYPFPASARVVTWEQANAAARLPDRRRGGSNKVEAGNGDLQRAGGHAGEKFRGSIAQLGAAGGVDQGAIARIRQLATRRGGNGGFLPFVSGAGGHVGRPVLEGSAQDAGNVAQSALCLKLGRLRDLRLRLAGAELEQLALGAIVAVSPRGTPGAPNPARASAAMLALHAGRIWIEDRAQGRFSSGHYSNRDPDGRKNAQTGDWRWGPGGAALRITAQSRCGSANQQRGERAGVKCLPVSARLHDAGEGSKLRRDFPAVNGAAA